MRRLGFKDGAIRRAISAGRLHPVFRGAYAVGHPRIGDRGRMMAAVLACGEGAVVSHRSAAALLGLWDRAPAVVEVIAAGDRGRKIVGIHAHRPTALAADEIGHVDAIPCTSPARTLVDLAGCVRLPSLRSAFERAAAAGLLELTAVEAVAARAKGRRGIGALRSVIDEWRPAGASARQCLRSPLEARLLPLLARNGLPMPRVNAPVKLDEGTIEVDFLWPEQRFAVEADSRGFHATEAAFELDRRRDRELMRAGYTTLRVTQRQVEEEPRAVIAAIRSGLAGANRGAAKP